MFLFPFRGLISVFCLPKCPRHIKARVTYSYWAIFTSGYCFCALIYLKYCFLEPSASFLNKAADLDNAGSLGQDRTLRFLSCFPLVLQFVEGPWSPS